ncbi:MAG: TetR family transcriptional regulator [Sphingomonas sp.]|nr:MAG: TetR family transcriptional regulator [Sphingomonas sp.]
MPRSKIVVDTEEPPASGRARLLEATSQVMRAADSLEVPLSDIAAKAGLNAALVRYYFGGKDGLLRALLERDAGASLAELDHLLEMDIRPSKKLRYHLAGLIGTYYNFPYLSRLMIKLLHEGSEEERQRIADRFLKPIARAYEVIVAEGKAIGEFRNIDPKLLYFNVIGTCDHLFSSSVSLKYCYGITEVDDALKRQYIDQVVTIFLKGVLVDGA